MNKNAAKVLTCVYKELRQTQGDAARNTVILTHPDDAVSVGAGLAGMVPTGSVCTGSVWTSPDGRTLSVKRYTDPVPAYKNTFKLLVCNGGRHMTREDGENLDRWRAGGPSPIPLVAP
jgi:hypothetical protein